MEIKRPVVVMGQDALSENVSLGLSEPIRLYLFRDMLLAHYCIVMSVYLMTSYGNGKDTVF